MHSRRPATKKRPRDVAPPQPEASVQSGIKVTTTGKRIRFLRVIPKGHPCLKPFEGLPANEYEAIRLWASHMYPFQRGWLFETERFALACKSRQIGWSYVTAAWIVIRAVYFGETTTIVSDKEDSAKKTLAVVKAHARILRRLGSTMARTRKNTSKELTFVGGGAAIAFSSKGSRSFSGNLVLDEFAYHQNPDLVWDASAPVLTTGRKMMRLISTPNGASNAFHERVEDARDPKSGWAYYHVPMAVAIADGYEVDPAAMRKISKGDPRLHAQMFECSFLDNVLQYIPGEILEKAKIAETLLRDGPGLYYAGLDIGHTSDRTVLTVVRMYQGKIYPVHIESKQRTDWQGMRAMVDWAFAEYRIRRLCVDKTGLGTFPAEEMQRRHGDRVPVDYRRNKVEMIDFLLKSKEMLATGLYGNLAEGILRLPAGDAQLPKFDRRDRKFKRNGVGEAYGPKIIANEPGTAALVLTEVAAIQRVVTTAGNITYVSPRTRQGHGDHAWSLALACHAIDAVHPAVRAMQERMGLLQEAS